MAHPLGQAAGTLTAPEARLCNLANLCLLPAWIRSLVAEATRFIPRIFRIMETGPVTASRRSQALVSDPDDRDPITWVRWSPWLWPVNGLAVLGPSAQARKTKPSVCAPWASCLSAC
jgi:hypothetical protein